VAPSRGCHDSRVEDGSAAPAASWPSSYNRIVMRMKYLCLTDRDAARLRATQPAKGDLEVAAWRLAALADPTRLRVALVLATSGELCVGDTATLLDLPVKLVSHHVRALAERGLATKERDGKLIRYRLTEDARRLLEAAFARDFAAHVDLQPRSSSLP
jgi:ArsR family transcriptional regulator, lead/cadmium/zinc/bismuth-responsive transcriptional repressor